jgi:hypothetical protein
MIVFLCKNGVFSDVVYPILGMVGVLALWMYVVSWQFSLDCCRCVEVCI